MEEPKAVSKKVNAGAFGGGGLGVLVAFAYEKLMGEPMPPEVAAAITGLLSWVFGYLKRD